MLQPNKITKTVSSKILAQVRASHDADDVLTLTILLKAPQPGELEKLDRTMITSWTRAIVKAYQELNRTDGVEANLRVVDRRGPNGLSISVPTTLKLTGTLRALTDLMEIHEAVLVRRVLRTTRRLEELGCRHDVARKVAMEIMTWDIEDIEILVRAVVYLREHDTEDVYERSLRIPGADTKWLTDHRRRLIETVMGAPLRTRQHAEQILVTRWIDPEYTGPKLLGFLPSDPIEPPYPVDTVVIIENDVCVRELDDVPGCVVVQGDGYSAASAGRLTAVPWIAQCSRILYWGDLDLAGLQILKGVRKLLPQTRSILMDNITQIESFELGVYRDREGKALSVPETFDTDGLASPERRAVRAILDGTAPPRIEQERIGTRTARNRILDVIILDVINN